MARYLEMFGKHRIISESRDFLDFAKGLDYVIGLGFGKLREGSYTDGGLEIKSVGYDTPGKRLKLVIKTKKSGMQEIYIILPMKEVPRFRVDVLNDGYNFVVN